MPYITANRIHDGRKWLPQGTVIELSADGVVMALLDSPTDDTQYFEGDLIPGFVNVHCHLELSHLKGLVPKHTGLVPFLQTIPIHRNDFTEEQKTQARHAAYHQLIKNGIVAVGDIANTTETLDIRVLDKLHFITFVEAIGFITARAGKSFGNATQVYDAYSQQPSSQKLLKQVITPHAPYSVSQALFELINEHREDALISIHNQESIEENCLYKNKTGNILELYKAMGIDYTNFRPSGKSSITTYTQWLAPTHPIIFVHNTYTKPQEIAFAMANFDEVYWCFCPNANLYIENTLPNINLFIAQQANICIGTDSLASNDNLCILSELITIKANLEDISWETLLGWATYNGAKALQMEPLIGSISIGKQPGIVQIIGLETMTQPIINCLF